jgi:hypothetical protein
LWHRTLGRIDQYERTVSHADDPFYLTAKISVTWRVDDIDFHAAVVQRDILGKNSDAAFLFKIPGIKDSFASQLTFAELATLAQQAIDQGGLPMIDMGDDDNVSNIVATHDLLGKWRELVL